MTILCVIPSRLHSTRLPRKPLLPIQGKPMVQWTYENAVRCAALDKVIVATDSPEIATVITQIGGETAISDLPFTTGTERVGAVAMAHPEASIIINLQGDEPFIQPKMLEQLIAPFAEDPQINMTTLAYPLAKEKHHEPGTVKVITDLNHDALYFSRAPIPYYRTSNTIAPVYNHMGVYAFRRDFLRLYLTLPQTPLDMIESLEQLRVLEHGYKIRVCLTSEATLEINTPEEYAKAQAFRYSV